jgi:hypothetical protein
LDETDHFFSTLNGKIQFGDGYPCQEGLLRETGIDNEMSTLSRITVIYKEQLAYVIGVEGDPVRGCVTV